MGIKLDQVLYGVDSQASELCEVLGIDPSRCKRLVIDMPADSPVVAYAEMYVTHSSVSAIKRVLQVSPRRPIVEVVEVPE